ncbi:Predicted L-lactate dehydrogenase, Iron-sulfur cluster-binding subunit YkgF [Olavius algarvensis Delta 1 endosymbiont]|nr:Predicted L-lactate dehydrogenase, Iron-sulfur cluster-binding subunit YkgF [Olavius algarvensis Delta 1 endosymbiont]
MSEIFIGDYKAEAKKALDNQVLQSALADLQNRFGRATALAYQRLPEGPDLRLRAHEIRRNAIANLDVLLDTLASNIRKNGGNVFFAGNADEALKYCLETARRHGAKLAVKGKSMVSEEIGLNTALEENGIEVAETDLGEYIVQLAGERPSHIIAPAIHKTRTDIGRLFTDKIGISYTDDPPSLTRAARKALREKFLAADIGFSGCNIACAETGHIVTVSNEGNIRMSSTMPRVHVAIMGMERIAARLEDHDILLRLLCRGAAAQNMATYASYIGGPRQADQVDGPEEFHLVILDNGRSRILADEEFREMLYCVRCAACLNVCPVYGKIGGHSYGHPYSGPVGAVIMPLLAGINEAKDLCQGETLCGACQDACPINIDIPRMLLALRTKLADGDPKWDVSRASGSEKLVFQLWSWMIRNRGIYDFFLRTASIGQKLLPDKNGMLRYLPPPFNGWTKERDIPAVADESFIKRWKKGL